MAFRRLFIRRGVFLPLRSIKPGSCLGADYIRYGNVLSMQAQRAVPRQAARLIELVVAETEDAIEVLEGAPLPELYAGAVADLETAFELEREALDTRAPKPRNDLLQEARALKEDARGMMVEEHSNVAMGEAVDPR